jgi:hypothetical protein
MGVRLHRTQARVWTSREQSTHELWSIAREETWRGEAARLSGCLLVTWGR